MTFINWVTETVVQFYIIIYNLLMMFHVRSYMYNFTRYSNVLIFLELNDL